MHTRHSSHYFIFIYPAHRLALSQSKGLLMSCRFLKMKTSSAFGLYLLEATLKQDFSMHLMKFQFWRAKTRDYGYRPQTQEEIAHWFDTVIDICTKVVLSGRSVSGQAKKLLRNNLRGLWTDAYSFNALEESVKKILKQGQWNDGWIAVREIINYDYKSFDDETKRRVSKLEALLRPNNLLEKARAFALSSSHGVFDGRRFDKERAPNGVRGHIRNNTPARC